MGPLTTPGLMRVTWTVIALFALLSVALSPLPSGAQGEVGRVDHGPIRLVGDEEVDAFFSGDGSDGLTPATAHILEGLDIVGPDDQGNCLYLENTTRHVIIRDCRFQDPSEGTDAVGVELQSSTGAKVEMSNGMGGKETQHNESAEPLAAGDWEAVVVKAEAAGFGGLDDTSENLRKAFKVE